MDRIKLIVDTDIGSDIDDALAIAYLLKQPRASLLGITTCSSEPCKRAMLADALCRAAGREIPIFPGRDTPLIGPQRQVAVHQEEVLAHLPHKTQFPQNAAVDFMKTAIEASPHEVALLAIGPLTNVGALFGAYPHLATLVKEVLVLGGSYFAQGHAFAKAEFNILNDPYAAQLLFSSAAPIRAMGLDVSLRTKTSARAFLQGERHGLFSAVATCTEKFTERTDDMYYHDAIPAVLPFCPEIVSAKRGRVQVGLGDDNYGQTLFTEGEDGNALVVYDMNADAFFRHYGEVTGEALPPMI